MFFTFEIIIMYGEFNYTSPMGGGDDQFLLSAVTGGDNCLGTR